MDPVIQEQIDTVKKASTPRKVTKFFARLIVGHCAAHVAKAVIQTILPEPESKASSAELAIGSYAIGGAVAMKARVVIDNDVDDIFDFFEKLKPKKTVIASVPEPDSTVTPSE